MLYKLISLYTPEYLKKKKLIDLFNLTAEAFNVDPPSFRGLKFKEVLNRYAIFTHELAQDYLRSGRSIAEIKERLYRNALKWGLKLRRMLYIRSVPAALYTLKGLYRMLEIDFNYSSQGEFEIKRCYFQQYYSASTCQLISSLDEGLAAGLGGGGSMNFSRRLTDGHSCCHGIIKLGENQ